MALNTTGAISLAGATAGQSIALELGLGTSTQISLNDTVVRGLAGAAFSTTNTTIQMPTDFYGKANAFTFNPTISTNTLDYDLRAQAILAGWDGITALNATVTVNSGVYLGATAITGFGFTWTGSYPSGSTLALINNGTIEGKGGNGGAGTTSSGSTGSNGGNGGTAIKGNYAISITNNGNIAGAGGGGCGGGYIAPKGSGTAYAGGGGAGYNVGTGVNNGTITGTGGAGRAGSGYTQSSTAGGNWGVNGVNSPYKIGGTAGKCTDTGTNAYITWVATGNRYGTLS